MQTTSTRPPLSRRQFLASASASTAVATLSLTSPGCLSTPHAAHRTPVVGTQLYGWGQYYHREGKDFDAHLDTVLSQVRDCGYDYAEGSLDAAHPEENLRFAEKLRQRGLRPVSLYSGGAFHLADKAPQTIESLTRACQVARKAGFEVLVCNPDPIGRLKTIEELDTQANALAQFGRELQTIGMTLALHHHLPEMQANAREFHSNFLHTPATTVRFCYDVHWVYRGGIAPDLVLPAYGDRIESWHLRQSRDKIWWEDLAPGDVDYPFIAQYVKTHQLARRLTVELALESGTRITRNALENHRRSREYLREVFRA